MNIRFAAVAKRELYRVHAYYERKMPGLGDAFLDDVTASLDLMKRHPRAWTAMGGSFYRRRLSNFRYGMVYRQDGDAIVVIAVGHLSRRPAFWRGVMSRKAR